jgi:hypothetical protein
MAYCLEGDDLQKPEVFVAEGGGGELPRSLEPGSVSVTPAIHQRRLNGIDDPLDSPAKGVSTAQSNNLLIVETHSVKDESEVILGLSGIGKSTVGQSIVVFETVGPARSPGDGGSTTLLNGTDTS